MHEEPLSDHPLMRELGKILGTVIGETTDADARWKQTRDYYPHEEYAKEVLLSAVEVQTILTQLRQTAVFLSNFRSTGKLQESGIERFDHIIYHLENFYIRVTGCFDRCLVLVNVVLDLGNEPEDCSYRLIKKNKHVRRLNIAGPLGEINGLIKPHRSQRDTIAHRQRLSEPDLVKIEMYHTVQKSNPEIIPEHILKIATDQLVAEKKEQINETTRKLVESVGRLFRTLKPEFDLHYERLKTHDVNSHCS